MVRVSVIIPTYNRARVVGEAIRSALDQTVRDIEVIVVDDGSTDDTRDAVDGCRDGRVRYIYKTNGGPASARNAGLAEAKGEYVAFLDHDDLWPARFLEVMTGALDGRPEFGLAYSPITLRYADGHEVERYKVREGESGWCTGALFRNSFVWTSASLMRRSVLKGFGYDETLRRSYEDGDFFLRLALRTPFLYIPETQAIKRVHEANLSVEVGTQPTRILVLERFYYRLGGDRHIGLLEARRRLSHACRSVAKVALTQGKRAQAIFLYVRAISYWPVDVRVYWEWARALSLSHRDDPEPAWRMPSKLGMPERSASGPDDI